MLMKLHILCIHSWLRSLCLAIHLESVGPCNSSLLYCHWQTKIIELRQWWRHDSVLLKWSTLGRIFLFFNTVDEACLANAMQVTGFSPRRAQMAKRKVTDGCWSMFTWKITSIGILLVIDTSWLVSCLSMMVHWFYGQTFRYTYCLGGWGAGSVSAAGGWLSGCGLSTGYEQTEGLGVDQNLELELAIQMTATLEFFQ